MSKSLLFIIYTCYERLNRAEMLYDIIKDKLTYCKVYICFGNPMHNIDTIIQDKYIVLQVGDKYGDLCNKTILLLSTVEKLFPEYKGIFKCDEDIVPNIDSINNYSKEFLENNIDYSGHGGNTGPPIYTGIKGSQFYQFRPPNLLYCAGSLYYLNMKSIKLFNEIRKDYFIFPEDLTVAYYLNKCNIVPTLNNLHTNNYEDYKLNSYQNIDYRIKDLYVILQCRLGNNLFQIASGYGIAKKYKMNLYFTWNESIKGTQDYFSENYRETIFKNKNLLFLNKELIKLDNKNIYSEINNDNNFMVHNPNIIKDLDADGIATKDTIINGYLQNEKYFKDYKQDIIDLFKNDEISNLLLLLYPNINKSCFIHIRRGDNNKYFKSAIEYMLNINNNMHFYILSDNIEYCKTYNILDNINKTFIEDMDVLPTLYLMGLTKYGIVHNSTFSWWGAYLNQTPDKIMILPKIWFNNNKPCDIYFEGSIVLDC
jgi:hypothetical protein